MDNAPSTLTSIDAAAYLDNVGETMAAYRLTACRIARKYAMRQMRRYSLEHPSRVCRLQARDGYCTLHVSTSNALIPFGEYIFGLYTSARFHVTDTRVVQSPPFLARLQAWGQALHYRTDDWFAQGVLDITFIAGEEQ